MRSLIRKVIREMASTNLKGALIAMGPKKAKKSLGINLEDFVSIVYDDDIVDYVSDFIPELTNLTLHSEKSYDYNGEGPLAGLVFTYIKRQKTRAGNIVEPYANIPKNKLEYLIKEAELLTEQMFLIFLNEYYDLNMTKIVPIRPTNFG